MDDLTKILLTSMFTAIGGVLVFVAGQVLLKFVIEPIQELKKLIVEINFGLVFHAQAIHTPVGDRTTEDEASKAFRKLACDLSSKVAAIPWYGFWSKRSHGHLPNSKDINTASSQLIGLSNSVYGENRSEINEKRVGKIRSLLNLKGLDE